MPRAVLARICGAALAGAAPLVEVSFRASMIRGVAHELYLRWLDRAASERALTRLRGSPYCPCALTTGPAVASVSSRPFVAPWRQCSAGGRVREARKPRYCEVSRPVIDHR